MRTLYTLILVILISPCRAQNYDLGLVHLGGYDFKIVAVPDFDSSGSTDVSDVGFTLMLPAGASDAVNAGSILPGRTWSITEFDAAFLSGLSLGDGTLDAFQFNMPPGQSLVAHTSGQQIDLVSFQVSNMPSSGQMSFLLNSDPIAMGAGGVLDSFYNSNIDNTSTQDYFNSPAPGLDSFNFETLSTEAFEMELNSFKMYPVPADDSLWITGNFNIEKISIYDLNGKLLLEDKNTEVIDVRSLSSGFYAVHINTAGGIITRKMVKR